MDECILRVPGGVVKESADVDEHGLICGMIWQYHLGDV